MIMYDGYDVSMANYMKYWKIDKILKNIIECIDVLDVSVLEYMVQK